MTDATLEIFVEPFRENAPGPHVTAAVDALTEAGFEPEMGPFATGVDGDLDELIAAATAAIRAGFAHGATAVQLRLERPA